MTTTQIPIIGWERRYMTARECARLQSMGHLKHLPEGIAAFKALGNAVNVTVVQKILTNLLPLLSAPYDGGAASAEQIEGSKVVNRRKISARVLGPALA
jgi:hypothetical protein